jgi:GDPmannose 4,6-dehydratase
MRLPSEVFGDINGAAADESTPFSTRSPDAVAKATAFWEVANYREADGLFASPVDFIRS